MKPKRSKKKNSTSLAARIGNFVDVFDGIKPGESKEIAPNIWATNLIMDVLDPPEPIKKPSQRKPKKK